jgi:hypothetical protein
MKMLEERERVYYTINKILGFVTFVPDDIKFLEQDLRNFLLKNKITFSPLNTPEDIDSEVNKVVELYLSYKDSSRKNNKTEMNKNIELEAILFINDKLVSALKENDSERIEIARELLNISIKNMLNKNNK